MAIAKFMSAGVTTTAAFSLTTGANLGAIVFPPKEDHQAVIRSLEIQSAVEADAVWFVGALSALQTTVTTAVADTDTTVYLQGDSSGYINGRQVADDSWLFLETDAQTTHIHDDKIVGHRFRLLHVASATESGGIAALTVVGLNGHTGVEGTAAVGNRAWLVPAGALRKVLLSQYGYADAGTDIVHPVSIKAFDGALFAAHDENLPVAVLVGSVGTNDLSVVATAEYVRVDDSIRTSGRLA